MSNLFYINSGWQYYVSVASATPVNCMRNGISVDSGDGLSICGPRWNQRNHRLRSGRHDSRWQNHCETIRTRRACRSDVSRTHSPVTVYSPPAFREKTPTDGIFGNVFLHVCLMCGPIHHVEICGCAAMASHSECARSRTRPGASR